MIQTPIYFELVAETGIVPLPTSQDEADAFAFWYCEQIVDITAEFLIGLAIGVGA